ncbi:MAG: cysteine desulfurase [Planctomycetes bacterium]|nr:cysteine desulfurase [Planctomycetota bacterium]
MSADFSALRAQFPLLARELGGRRIAWLDNASTTPRPRAVLEALREYHEQYSANVHRGVHALAAEASERFEAARDEVANFLGASSSEIVFTSGTTEAANLVAGALGLAPQDEVLLTGAEHHSNLLPWRQRCATRVLELDERGTPLYAGLAGLFTPRTRLVAVHHASNVLGAIAPLREISALAHARGIPVFVDGAQGAGHLALDVRELECDFYAFSGHKLGGPSGSGALYAREDWLERLAPQRWGGGMVARVDAQGCELRSGPQRFEAGTPNVEGVLGLAAALRLLREIGMPQVEQHGRELARALLEERAHLPGVRLLGPVDAAARIPLVALALPPRGLDAETAARTLSDAFGVLVSAGRHCAHPLHDACGVEATLRASAWVHNDLDDVRRFGEALRGLIA